jgi:uncharacterized repeat protein (TIGR03803 family)
MKKTSSSLGQALAILGSALLCATTASATSNEKVIHSFASAAGANPFSSLVFDSAGNLYGTTQVGGGGGCEGHTGCGTVFQLTPATGGGWTYHMLHAFELGNGDGIFPSFSSGLVLDAAGNLYGTTWQGGAIGDGCVFEVSPHSDGSWSESVIYSFAGSPDGNGPQAGLVFDAAGNLYGTTIAGGANGSGAVFQLTPTTGVGWSESVIHSFAGSDGGTPYAPLVVDAAGNLYGTATYGGSHQNGVVFELSPASGGSWTDTVLYNFTGKQDGGDPQAGLLLDSAGNLYGTNNAFHADGVYGAVFKLAPNSDGTWTETSLHTFSHAGDGSNPRSGLVWDAAGNLYGTTYVGGAKGAGTVYKLSPNSSGGWIERILYSFTGSKDGDGVLGGVILDSAGHLYGTTAEGGSAGYGVVFEMQQ